MTTCDVNAVLLAELNEVVVVEMRMGFDLIDFRFHRAFLEEALQLRSVEVRDADGFDHALLVQSLELAPSVHEVHAIVRIEKTVLICHSVKSVVSEDQSKASNSLVGKIPTAVVGRIL